MVIEGGGEEARGLVNEGRERGEGMIVDVGLMVMVMSMLMLVLFLSWRRAYWVRNGGRGWEIRGG